VARSPSHFVKSEVHVGNPSALVHAALSFQGAALNDDDAIALAVLKHAMGKQLTYFLFGVLLEHGLVLHKR